MKILKFIILFLFIVFSVSEVHAIEFKLLVLPTGLFSVCDNYFCFPEVSNIMAEDTINNFHKYQNIKVLELSDVRKKLESNSTLKEKTKNVLKKYADDERIDFVPLQEIAREFDVKSVLLITSYASNDRVNLRRNLWDVLEISGAFGITYPFELKTSSLLTDCVNNIVMWSGKYSKQVSNNEGYFRALNQSQAMSHLEKIRLYSKDNISQNISQNVYMRFFPREVRTFYVTQPKTDEPSAKFMPNALEHLKDSHLRKDFENGGGLLDFNDSSDDLIFEF